jgi:hypothetical protein
MFSANLENVRQCWVCNKIGNSFEIERPCNNCIPHYCKKCYDQHCVDKNRLKCMVCGRQYRNFMPNPLFTHLFNFCLNRESLFLATIFFLLISVLIITLAIKIENDHEWIYFVFYVIVSLILLIYIVYTIIKRVIIYKNLFGNANLTNIPSIEYMFNDNNYI